MGPHAASPCLLNCLPETHNTAVIVPLKPLKLSQLCTAKMERYEFKPIGTRVDKDWLQCL